MNPSFSSNSIVISHEISKLVRLMPEGDRVKVLSFCQALREQRTGKQEQRRNRFKQQNLEVSASSTLE